MTTWLFLIALSLNGADAAITCRQLRQEQTELNPVMGQSCGRIVGVKAAFLALTPVIDRRWRNWYLGSLAVGGGIGVAVSLKF